MVSLSLSMPSEQRTAPVPGPLLSVENLAVEFSGRDGTVRAVDGLSFSVAAGETLGIVGESGCGKSVTALTLMRLIPSPPGRIAAGRIALDGVDLMTLPESAMREIRGNRIAMIFQEPMTSLNPVLTIGRQITETLSRAPETVAGGGHPARRGTAGPGRHRRAGAAPDAISA